MIAAVFSPREIGTARSDIILSKPILTFCDKTCLFTHEPMSSAMVKVAEVLIRAGVCPDYSHVSAKPERHGEYFLAPSCTIGEASDLGPGCIIHENVSIGRNSSIGAYTEVFPGTVIGDDVRIGSGCSIGANALFRVVSGKPGLFPGIGRVRIGNSVSIGNSVTIQRGAFSDTVIGENTVIGNLIDIAHGVTIGTDCFIVSQTGIAGEVSVGDHVTIYGQAGIANGVRLGNHVTVYGQSCVTKNVNDFQRVSGTPAFDHRKAMSCLARMRRKSEQE